jgi:hypothetical protein
MDDYNTFIKCEFGIKKDAKVNAQRREVREKK